jgi:hypothetical protein
MLCKIVINAEDIALNSPNGIIPLTFKRRSADCFSPYRAVNSFHLGYKNQSVFYVNGTSRSLFSDKYKTRKYSVGRAYTC